MKYLLGLIFCLFWSNHFLGQISVTTDIPAEVLKNKEIVVNIKFNKGPIKNYSKYEMTIPRGIIVRELDSKYGAFNFENNKVRIIWAITPADHEYIVKIKLLTGNEIGPRQITQTYAYAEKGQKLELEMATVNFNIVDSLTNSGAETNKEITNIKTDSKEAQEVGNKEKASAEARIQEAKLAIQKAETITDEREREDALKTANDAKRKAEADLAEAERILVLSNSLNENAKEIEKLNQPIDSIIKVDNSKLTSTSNESNNESQSATKPPIKIEKAIENAMNKGAAEGEELYKDIKPEEHHDDQEIEQQVSQLRLDSKDALEVGTREKFKAEQSLHEGYDALKKAKYMPETEEKKQAIAAANEQIEQAKGDLEIASKILALSKSLEENAKEIERLHLGDQPKQDNTPKLAVNSQTTSKTTTTESKEQVIPISNVVANSSSKPASSESANTEKEQVAASSNTSVKANETASETSPSNSNAETNASAQTTIEVNTNNNNITLNTTTSAEKNEGMSTTSAATNESVEKPIAKNNESNTSQAEMASIEKTEKKEVEKPKPTIVETKVAKVVEPVSINKSNNNAFTLQVGSFVNSPDMSKFKKLGKVELKTDNGRYKVFYGKFATKQEASDMRKITVDKGFDCFVVTLNK